MEKHESAVVDGVVGDEVDDIVDGVGWDTVDEGVAGLHQPLMLSQIQNRLLLHGVWYRML